MPERAELREFRLSDFYRSGYLLLCAAFVCGCLMTLALAFQESIVPGQGYFFGGVSLLAALLARLFWLKADRPAARLSAHGLTLEDGLLGSASLAWTGVYAIERTGKLAAELRLSGKQHRTIELSKLEREERAEFVEAVKRWISCSH